MKPFAKLFAHMFSPMPTDNDTIRASRVRREWDRQRSLAMSPSELAEIDAIFARNL